MAWEIDHSRGMEVHGARRCVWARNQTSQRQRSRDWKWVAVASLRAVGLDVPIPNTVGWEIDWTKRKGKTVWARNPLSHARTAREWHWVPASTLNVVGISWVWRNEAKGRSVDSNGYVVLRRCGMSTEDIALAEEHDLFLGTRRQFLKEHQLIAVKAFGSIPPSCVVRHINGVKTDNRPENLALGWMRESNDQLS